MNPQQDPGGNPYDFIMNDAKPPKKTGVAGGVANVTGNGFIMKLVFIVGGMIIFMIVVAIAINVLTGSKTNVTDLITLAETQNEVARVAGEGATQSTTQAVLNAANNTQLSVMTQQTTLVKYIATKGHKLSPKILGTKKNAATDTQLTAATAASTYDLVFNQILGNELTNYASLLKQYYGEATSNTVKTMLATDYQQVQTLLEQVPSQASLQTD